jgi:hypothetical protein
MSAIEKMIEAMDDACNAEGEGLFIDKEIAAARAELERLRDAELLLRKAWNRWMDWERDIVTRKWTLDIYADDDDLLEGEADAQQFILDDDGTGLPLLTPAARSALRAGQREETT